MLPKQKTIPKTDFLTTKTCIVGAPKCGKSTFASQLGNGVLFLATESGLDFLSVYKIDIKSYADFSAAVKELTETKHDFHTIVIDVVDKLFDVVGKEIATRNKVQNIEDIPYGGGYAAVKRLLEPDLALLESKFGVTYITHQKEKEFKQENMSWTVMATSLGKSYEEWLLGRCDLILYGYVNSTGKRLLRTKPNKYIQCAGDRSNKLPEVMDMDPALVTKALTGAVVQPAASAPPAQAQTSQAATKISNQNKQHKQNNYNKQ